MRVIATAIPDVRIVEPRVFTDERGHFLESWNARAFRAAGIDAEFVQDNHSRSRRGVLRGLHYQVRQPQGKLVRVVAGAVFDVAVDLRASSPTFARSVGITLTADEPRMLWVPPGFAHGFCVLSEVADLVYKCTALYEPQNDRSIAWNDPAIGIDWPVGDDPIVSAKDAAAPTLADASVLPQYES